MSWTRVAFLFATVFACGGSVPAAAEPEPGGKLRRTLRLDEIWKGDLDGIAERGRVRILVTYSMTNYFLDGARPRGITYELGEEFVKSLNEKLGRRRRPIAAVYIPVSRGRIIDELAAGRGDIAAANLTPTDVRLDQVDFSEPFGSGVRELVVSGPGAPPLETLEDLSGVEVWVRPSSSFHESLEALNERLRSAGRAPVAVQHADEQLETEDLLEMVNAGLVPATVADSHMASFWGDVLPDLVVREDLVLRENGSIAWALRKDTPQLAEAVNAFARSNKKGSLLGNILHKRYLRTNPWVRNARAERARERLHEMIELFRAYGDRYGFDWLMVAAQAYQESGLDQSLVSAVGAVGVMQVLPSTAASHEVRIPEIEDLENNIHAGVKYLRVLVDRYFNDPELDVLNRHLLAFAGYNAGPNRIQRLRGEAERMGLDPNVWFENVEVVVARNVGSEPVRYAT